MILSICSEGQSLRKGVQCRLHAFSRRPTFPPVQLRKQGKPSLQSYCYRCCCYHCYYSANRTSKSTANEGNNAWRKHKRTSTLSSFMENRTGELMWDGFSLRFSPSSSLSLSRFLMVSHSLQSSARKTRGQIQSYTMNHTHWTRPGPSPNQFVAVLGSVLTIAATAMSVLAIMNSYHSLWGITLLLNTENMAKTNVAHKATSVTF